MNYAIFISVVDFDMNNEMIFFRFNFKIEMTF